MTCQDIVEFLMDYAAGAVSQEERAVFEAHLAACPPCVAYLKTYEVTVQVSQKALAGPGPEALPPMPEELVAAILAARKRRE